jgi:hypothetical protein
MVINGIIHRSLNVAGWKILYKWRFIAGKIIKLNGGFPIANV